MVVLDAADLTAVSTFWAGLLGGTVAAEDDWHTVLVDGEPRIGVQLAPTTFGRAGRTASSSRSTWTCTSRTSAPRTRRSRRSVRRCCARPTVDAAEGFQVYADPAGHPFCLCWG